MAGFLIVVALIGRKELTMKDGNAFKVWGTLLIVAGVVLVIAGIYGFAQLSGSGMTGEQYDWAFGAAAAFGMTGYMSAGERFTLWLVRNRSALLAIGIIAAVAGGLLWYPLDNK